MAPHEREFWDLDADPDPADMPADMPADPSEAPENTPGDKTDASQPPAAKPTMEPAAEPAQDSLPPTVGEEHADPSPSHPATPESTQTGGSPTENVAKHNSKRSRESTSGRAEKISLIILGVLLMGIAIWAVGLFFSKIPTEPKQTKIDFPVAGQFVTINEVRTYWRRPDREKDVGVRQKAKLIPAALVTLGKSSSQGTLRFFFENDSGETVGDTTTQSATQGLFTENKASEMEVHATAGFEDRGDHAAYLTGQIDHWHLVIKEALERNSAGRDFTEILRIPISATRQ